MQKYNEVRERFDREIGSCFLMEADEKMSLGTNVVFDFLLSELSRNEKETENRVWREAKIELEALSGHRFNDKKKHDPYNFTSLRNLTMAAHNDGGYSGRKTHFTLVCEGEFEGFSGRATEAWETRFKLTTPAGIFTGDTIESACKKALDITTNKGK